MAMGQDPWQQQKSPGPGLVSGPPAMNWDQTSKNLFSDKVAMTKENQYDGIKNAGGWKTSIRNYWVSKAREMDPLLRLVDQNEDVTAT